MITTSAAAAVTSQESPVSDVKEFGGTKSRKKFESGLYLDHLRTCVVKLCVNCFYTGENDFGSYEPPGCILGGVTAMSIYIIRKAEPRSALDYLNIVCFARQ